MKRLLALLGALFLCLPGCSGPEEAPAPAPGPTPSGTTVVVNVYTNSTIASRSDVQQWCVDLELQFNRDIEPAWGVSATFTLVDSPPTEWPALIVEDSTGSGNQGQHDNVTAWVDVQQSISQNGTPEASAGKEIIEVVLERAVTGQVAPYAYPAGGLNAPGPYVLHDWLRPDGTDYMGILTQPGTIAPGGLDD